MPLDPHVRRLLRALSLSGASEQASPGIAQRREAFRGLMRLSDIGTKVAAVEQRDLMTPDGPLAIRIYTPVTDSTGPLPGLVYLHGGGFICGDLDTHDPFCRTLCDATGTRLIAVGYRLAPEHKFPAAFDDALFATNWVVDHADEIPVDPSRIGVIGDSAGATLAASVCNELARTRPRALALQVLLCPILANDADTVSRRELGQGYLLDRRGLAEEMAFYLPTGQNPLHPRVSPLYEHSFAGLPPTCIHTAEFDPLRDEGLAYAEALRTAGIEVRHTCHPGMIHLFYAFGRAVPFAHQAHRQLTAEVAAHLGPRMGVDSAWVPGV